MLRAFLSTFAVTFVAELPDKTAFAALLLSTRVRPAAVFVGAAAAFAVHTALAVAFGSILGVLPVRAVRAGAGALFLGLAVAAVLQKGDRDAEEEVKLAGRGHSVAVTAFIVIFLAEWGDLTQFSTAALTAHFHAPGVVFAGAVLALWSATAVAVFMGSRLKLFLHPKALRRAAVGAFAAVGVALLASAAWS